MSVRLTVSLVAALLGLALPSAAQALTFDFETGLDPFFTYSGIFGGTPNPPGSGSGYESVLAFTASSGLIYNPNGASPATVSLTAAGTFDLVSFVIAGAWGYQTLTIEGLNDSIVTFSTPLAVTSAAQVFGPGWTNIDEITITIDPGGYVDTVEGGAGQHWALDDLTITSSTPEPSTALLIGMGLVALSASRRRSRDG